MKITGGAGFSADAIEVFEGINGTLLLAALSLVIFLLIVIYRSPIFFLIPLVAVIFAETLSRSIGYGVSELGVTINGQSSSIMSVLVLGAGTDYALLLVARYREELHHTVDKHEAMRTALASAGPAIFASAPTVIAALLCLMLAKVNGTAGLGPIAAIGHRLRGALDADPAAGAADDLRPPRLLALRPAHAGDRAQPRTRSPSGARRRIVEGSRRRRARSGSSSPACWSSSCCRWSCSTGCCASLSGRRIPSLIVGPLDRAVFTPYEMRRHRLEHAADATHGFWKRVGDRVAARPQPRDGRLDRRAARLLRRLRLLLDRTDQRRQPTAPKSNRSKARTCSTRASPRARPRSTDIVVAERRPRSRRCSKAVARVDGVEAVSPPVAEGPPGMLVQATLEPNPYSTEAFDLVEPIRDAAHGAAPERPGRRPDARSNSTSATPPAGTRS